MIFSNKMMWLVVVICLIAGGSIISGTFLADRERGAVLAAEVNHGQAGIPSSYGTLKDIKYIYPDRKHNIAELWFVDKMGTIRIVTVDKGKHPEDKVVVSQDVRFIRRNEK